MIKIQQLSDETINQIAAGEVVENPAAVVKELIENAIDAKATDIVVEIVMGGFSLIKISDNGFGMNQEEARRAFLRHTTSKLSSIEDLNTLFTMGFRGEALASIASVAKVQMVTSDGNVGTEIVIHGGKLIKDQVKARSQGTTISVESLFYNTPARKSFQKSASISTSEIVKVVTKASLAYPECNVTLISQGEVLLSVQKEGFETRVKEILGFDQEALVDFADSNCKVFGVIGNPSETRVNRSGQYLFINRRPIISYTVSYAVLEGYGTRIDAKRFPVFALCLEIDPKMIDVNVHPQKSEVRFKDERFVASLFRRAVFSAFQKKEAPEFHLPLPSRPIMKVDFENFSFREKPTQTHTETPYFKEKSLKADFEEYTLREKEAPNGQKISCEPKKRSIHVKDIIGPFALFEDNKACFLMDLLAAKSRIVFDQVIEQKKIAIEQFLFPEVMEFSLLESACITSNIEKIEKVGIALRPFGSQSFLLEGLATYLTKDDVKDFLSEVLRVESLAEQKWAELASRFARKSATSFSLESAKLLIESFYALNKMPYCPKGKAIVVPYTKETLEKLFA
ncbi:MAG: DNA mismatch repair endonuclease MutL [Chlamydiae bacterium]|nr:DNA mismatch repair endonuclease MutL [Chlamydiota bacterium]